MAVAEAPTSGRQHLIVDARRMRCPRCKEPQDILRFKPLGQIEEFADETNPIYQCPLCRWKFSPAQSVLEDFIHAV